MNSLNSKEYKVYAVFLNNLAKELTKFYYSKLDKTFKVSKKKYKQALGNIYKSKTILITSGRVELVDRA